MDRHQYEGMFAHTEKDFSILEEGGRLGFGEYERLANGVAIYPGARKMRDLTGVMTDPELHDVSGLVYTTLGLAGESGEIANKVKKILRDRDGVLDPAAAMVLAGELGDVLWYLARTANELGFSLEHIAEQNLVKLYDRKKRNAIQGEGDNR